ncbi:MAG: acyl-CoA dehydratase activase [Sedimentisphaerales bacterium]
MQPDKQTGKIKWTSVPIRKLEPVKGESGFSLGIDLGSTSSDVVILDKQRKIVYSSYKRTKGKAAETLVSQLEELLKVISIDKIESAAATGSASRLISSLLEIPYVNEVSAQALAIAQLYPHFSQATVIEMGGQDSKLIFLRTEKEQLVLTDFALNSVCAAGTGSFLDQQAQRLGVNIEDEFGKMAQSAKHVPTLAGRCSVFAKSDMIHLQQQATPTEEIIAGLCLALARNLKSNLGKGREFIKPIIFTGGVAANIGVVSAIEKAFGLQAGQLIVPKEHFFTGAIGAVLASNKNDCKLKIDRLYEYIDSQAQGGGLQKAPRREALSTPFFAPPQGNVHKLPAGSKEKIEAYLGVDVGSISTNVVVMDNQKNVLSKVYLMTAGRPLEAVKKGLQIAVEELAGRVEIKGAATTGSGRYLTGDFIGADIVINEITAQATGAAIVHPAVDTIFEIGGQDSKFILLKDGVVVDFEMNHACAAGTGSFLEEQAEKLGISIKDEFAALAFQSEAPIKLGERCTVFMESDLLDYQQHGAGTKDLVAGLAYSIVTNYLNRVVGRRKLGDNICFQGGTAFNKAVWAAFEKIVGKPVRVPDHHEVTGALGAAAIAADFMKKQREENKPASSKFRGFENLVSIEYEVETFECEHCSNNCEVKKVALPGCEPLFYGSRCDRYNVSKVKKHKRTAYAFEFRQKMLRHFSQINGPAAGLRKEKIGIPMALANWQFLPLFSVFFKNLGFEPCISSPTGRSTVKKGVESVTAEPCFPVKVAFGHIAELIEQEVDYIFLPSIVNLEKTFELNKTSKLCPYVQSLPYQAKAAYGGKLGKSKILSPVIRLGDGKNELEKSFVQVAAQLKVKSTAAKKAIEKALAAQKAFEESLIEEGRRILSSVKDGGKLFVLVSRPYNGCDTQISLSLADKLAELGIDMIPMDMLSVADASISDEDLHENMYWGWGQKILRTAEIIKRDKRLFAVYLSNFSCGPDSFLMTFFKDIMADKPCLFLELDEHSADAGLITRLEAFLDSLSHYKPKETAKIETKKNAKTIGNRKIYIPYMGDCSYGMAAAMKAHGRDAEVMKCADEKGLNISRRFTTGKECLPCAITTGDMLAAAQSKEFDPAKSAFFMPSTSGPCRLGLYNCLQKHVLGYAGLNEAMVVSPNQDTSFYDEFAGSADKGRSKFMLDAWVAMAGIDILSRLLLKIRPYTKNKNAAEQIYSQCLKLWIEAAENRLHYSRGKKLMADFARRFGALEFDWSVRKPRIGIVGEIYVRNHPFANNNVIKRLEELGAACSLASLAEWIYYTNFTRLAATRRNKELKNYLVNLATNFLEHRIEKALVLPVEKKFGKLTDCPMTELLNYSKPYMHDSFEGEAILSIAKTVEFFHDGYSGVVNVMPFSCMPSTIVSSITPQISKDCENMPILNISFDGSEDATLQTRLEAFFEQCSRRESSLMSISEVLQRT